jgi:hypothetical protein
MCPGVAGTLDVSAPCSTFLEFIVIGFLLDLLHDLGVYRE